MTTIIFGTLVFFIYSSLIVGLIRPSIILRWSKKPTRLKVLGLWLISLFVVPVLALIIEDKDITKDQIEIANENIKNKNYKDAINSLSQINEDNPLYSEARKLINKADSLNNLVLEIERLKQQKEYEAKAVEQKRNQKVQLEREIKSINDGIDFSSYRGTVDALQLELILFANWRDLINNGENSDDSEIIELAKQLKPKVVSVQIKEFPKLRKEYGRIVANKMWENDIEVTANGSNFKYINFSGGIFAANKNKQDFQNEVNEVLKMFRFNQSRYRWYKEADEYTYWTIYEGKDSDLVNLDK